MSQMVAMRGVSVEVPGVEKEVVVMVHPLLKAYIELEIAVGEAKASYELALCEYARADHRDSGATKHEVAVRRCAMQTRLRIYEAKLEAKEAAKRVWKACE